MLKVKEKKEGYEVNVDGTTEDVIAEWQLLTASMMEKIAVSQKLPYKTVKKSFKKAFKAAKKAAECSILSGGIAMIDEIDLMAAEMH